MFLINPEHVKRVGILDFNKEEAAHIMSVLDSYIQGNKDKCTCAKDEEGRVENMNDSCPVVIISKLYRAIESRKKLLHFGGEQKEVY